MKIYKILSVVVLFVLCLVTSSLTATAQQKFYPLEGVQSTNCDCQEPINIDDKTIVNIDVTTGKKGIIYNNDTLNIPIIAKSLITGKILPLHYDANEPISIKNYSRGKNGKTFYLVPDISHVDYFYKAVVETDGVIVKKIYTTQGGIHSVTEWGTKLVCNHKDDNTGKTISALSIFENDTLVKTVNLLNNFLPVGEISENEDKIISLLEKTTSQTYYGIGYINPQTGEVFRMDNNKTNGGTSNGPFVIKNGKLYWHIESAYIGGKAGLFLWENNDWTMLGIGLNLPIQDITTGQWTVYMRVGNQWNGKTADVEGHYLILGDTDIVLAPKEDYRLHNKYIPQEYIEKIWQMYGFMPDVAKIIEINGVEYGIGAGILSKWTTNATNGVNDLGKKNNLNIYPNPANSTVSISGFDFNSQNYKFEIMDVLGKVLLKGQTNGIIDISNLVSGMYTIVLLSSSDVYTTKLIKE